jgi:hypothetical protein
VPGDAAINESIRVRWIEQNGYAEIGDRVLVLFLGQPRDAAVVVKLCNL